MSLSTNARDFLLRRQFEPDAIDINASDTSSKLKSRVGGSEGEGRHARRKAGSLGRCMDCLLHIAIGCTDGALPGSDGKTARKS